MKRCAKGDLEVELPVAGRDQIAELCRDLDRMRVNLRERIAADACSLAENLRLRQGLDEASVEDVFLGFISRQRRLDLAA